MSLNKLKNVGLMKRSLVGSFENWIVYQFGTLQTNCYLWATTLIIHLYSSSTLPTSQL